MAPDDRCPVCGAERASGFCTRCLIRLGLDGPGSPVSGEGGTTATLAWRSSVGRSGILETLAATIGTMPRVLLRDPVLDESPAPVLRTASGEMPERAERPERLQLFGEIARGGMGAVLKGRDPDLGRELAVKVLLDQHRNRPELVRRFIEEAQIAGQLQHPGIVPIYELGTFADRRPYFSMKLVKGRTLAELLAERVSGDQDLPRFLPIYKAVCQTMAYAHARGVIHRDLKPSNVMVGSFGEVQVMDWGLAKILPRGGVIDDASAGKDDTPVRGTVIATVRCAEDGDLSQAGSIMGTPSYMAPEQARGEIDQIDERADVFALGSILCEILTGQPAFVGRDSCEIQRRASLGDLTDAVNRLESCGSDGELVNLAKSCLARLPDDRPRNAGAVAERVKAYLAGVQERLLAFERERAAAEARAITERTRRRLARALSASLLALVALGVGGYAWVQRQRAHRAQDTMKAVNLALDRVALRRAEAEVALADAPARWEAALTEAKRADDLARYGESDNALRRRTMEVLETVCQLQGKAEAKARRVEADRALQAQLADIRLRQSEGNGDVLFDESSTDARYSEAFRAAGIVVDASESAEIIRCSAIREDLIAALDNWTRLKKRGKVARSTLRKLADAADDNAWRRRLRFAVEREDVDALKRLASLEETASQLPSVLSRLGVTLRDVQLPEEAEKLLRQVQAKHPGDFWVNYELGVCLLDLHRADAVGFLHAAVAIHPESAGARWALALAQRNSHDPQGAIRTFRYLETLAPKDYWVAISLGEVLQDQGEMAQATAEYQRSIALKSENIIGHYKAGDALIRQGKNEEAAAELREAIRIEPGHAPSHAALGQAHYHKQELVSAVSELREAIRLQPDLVEPHANLALALRDQGKVDEAVAECRTAIRIKPDCAVVQNTLGNMLMSQGKLDEAIIAYRDAIRVKPDFARAHTNLGVALKDQGNLDESVRSHREAVRLLPDSWRAHNNLGLTLQALGQCESAITAYREAMRLKPCHAAPHINLGSLFCSAKHDYDAAIVEFREAIRLQPTEPIGHVNLGIALKAQGKFDDAIAACREAIRVKPDCAMARAVLGDILGDQGELDKAISECREAIRLQPNLIEAHVSLGLALRALGKLDDSLGELRKAAALARARSPLARELPCVIRQVERQIELSNRLSGVLAGTDPPKNAAEGVIFAQICYDRRLYVAAARLWADALSTDVKLADDRRAYHRYNAACSAALAASGHAKDDPPSDESAKTMLRQQALEWLIAEREVWTKALQSNPAESRPLIVKTLQHWKRDRDLASLRDPNALAELPSEAQKAWRAFWADVEELLTKAQGGESAPR
jgi:eukaryotic-like serine/threonine-protein kinase